MKKSYIFGIALGILILILDILFLFRTRFFNFVLVVAFIGGAVPFVVSVIFERNRQRDIESKFLEFTRDLVENVKSGTPISKSIINLKSRNYGVLSFYIQKLSNQISMGIPLAAALSTFSGEINSPAVSRAVSLISEAEKAGGKIDSILESVSDSINQSEQLKKERKSAIYNLVVQGYIIFIIFIIIMLILEFKILPMIPAGQEMQGLSVKVKSIDPQDFAMPLLVLLIVQSVFSGLVIGKISEGTLRDGVKHSFILLAMTLLIKTGVSAIFG